MYKCLFQDFCKLKKLSSFEIKFSKEESFSDYSYFLFTCSHEIPIIEKVSIFLKSIRLALGSQNHLTIQKAFGNQ